MKNSKKINQPIKDVDQISIGERIEFYQMRDRITTDIETGIVYFNGPLPCPQFQYGPKK